MSENVDLVRSTDASLKRGNVNPAECARPAIEFRFEDDLGLEE